MHENKTSCWASWSIFSEHGGPQQRFGCCGWSGVGPMCGFCVHFGAQAAPLGDPLRASLGQERYHLGHRIDQNVNFWRKGAPDQNTAICYVFGLLGRTLASIGQFEGAPGGLIGGKGSPCAGIRALRFYLDLWKRSETDANGRKWTQPRSNPSRIRGQNIFKSLDI